MIMFIYFFRLCPLGLTMNFNTSKVAYCSWTKTHFDKCKVKAGAIIGDGDRKRARYF